MKKASLVIIIVCLGIQFGCVSHKQFVYFQTVNEGRIPTQEIQNEILLRIQPNDILAIHVSSFDQEASQPFNLNDSRVVSNQEDLSAITNYLVDQEGFIEIPTLGKFNVGGLTISDAKLKLHEELASYLKDAIVNMRILNFRVNVLGEVRLPGAYSTIEESFNVIEAITQAGDITDHGNRQEVQIIREYEDRREFATLDLLSSEVFESPYYYLRQNDIIYVPPQKTKTTSLSFQPVANTVIPLAGLSISILSLLITLNR